jgi:hypothetical protein
MRSLTVCRHNYNYEACLQHNYFDSEMRGPTDAERMYLWGL